MTRPTDGSGFRSSLGAYAPAFREADPANGLRAGGAIWRQSDRKILVVNLDHLRSWTDRKAAELLGDRLYGDGNSTKGTDQ